MRSKIKIAFGVVVVLAAIAIITTTIVLVTANNIDERCKYPNLPLGIYGSWNDDGFFIQWYVRDSEVECKTIYNLQYSVDGGGEFNIYTQDTNFTLEYLSLEICSTIYFRVWVISEDGTTNAQVTMNNYTEVPENANITNIRFSEVGENMVITWDKPIELTKCNVQYRAVISSELSTYLVERNTESILVPYDKYCYRLTALIQSYVGLWYVSYVFATYEAGGEITGIQFEVSPETEELTLTWDNEPKEDLCSLMYSVDYLNDDNPQSLNTTSPEAIFNFTYCADTVAQIYTNSSWWRVEGPYLIVDATQYPDYTFDISATPQDAITLISWEESPSIETCNVTYLINITTDLGGYAYVTETKRIELPDDLYCAFLSLQVQAVVGKYVGNPSKVELKYDLNPVSDLVLTEGTSNDLVVATWSKHRKHEMCEIEYLVTFSDGIIKQTKTTNQSSISFDLFYCETAFVIVEAVRGDSISEGKVATYTTGSPTSVGKVQDVTTDEVLDGTIRVNWNPPAYVNHCDIEYTVTATHPEAGSTTCSGSSSCDITLSGFCPSTSLEIVASSLDGHAITGEPAIETHICW